MENNIPKNIPCKLNSQSEAIGIINYCFDNKINIDRDFVSNIRNGNYLYPIYYIYDSVLGYYSVGYIHPIAVARQKNRIRRSLGEIMQDGNK